MPGKDPLAVIDNSLTTWGFGALAAIAAINGLWGYAAFCAAVSGCGWAVHRKRAKSQSRKE